MSYFSIDSLVIILQLILIEGLLSLDNAAVLGTLVANLPTTPIPIPRLFKYFAPFLHRYFGHQRSAALRIGILGAYLGRGLMIVMANFIISNTWLKILSGLYLLKLSFSALSRSGYGRHQKHENISKLQTFWRVVLTVELTDLAFSIDNVVTAAALSNKIWLVIIGVVIGITIMRFAAQLFSILVTKQPEFKNIAYLLVLNISLEILSEQIFGIRINDFSRFLISFLTIVLSILYLRLSILHFLKPVLVKIRKFMGTANNYGDKIFFFKNSQ